MGTFWILTARLMSASRRASAARSTQQATMVAADGRKPAGAVIDGNARMPAPTVLPVYQMGDLSVSSSTLNTWHYSLLKVQQIIFKTAHLIYRKV